MITKPFHQNSNTIPTLNFQENPYHRIEIGTSLGANRKSISSQLKKHYSKHEFIQSIIPSETSFFRKLIQKKTSVQQYLIKNGQSSKDIQQLALLLKENKLFSITCDYTSLSTAEKQVIEFFIERTSSKVLLISTQGMHVFLLECTYSILHDFTNLGGRCLEITYPPFEKFDEMGYNKDYLPKVNYLK